MNSFVPKHKSYLKASDLQHVAKPTKAEEDAAHEKFKRKDGFDIMFDNVTKDQRALEKADRAIKVKVDCRRRKPVDEGAAHRETAIKAASLFQTATEDAAVRSLIEDAERTGRMREIAQRAQRRTVGALKKVDTGDLAGVREPSEEDGETESEHRWIEVGENLLAMPAWRNAGHADLSRERAAMWRELRVDRADRGDQSTPSPRGKGDQATPSRAYATKQEAARHSLAVPKSTPLVAQAGIVKKRAAGSRMLPAGKRKSLAGSRAGSRESILDDRPLVAMQVSAPYHATTEIALKDTWSVGPLSKFTYEERQVLRQALGEEIERYQAVARERYADGPPTSLMIGGDEHRIRNAVMRRNTVQQLKH